MSAAAVVEPRCVIRHDGNLCGARLLERLRPFPLSPERDASQRRGQ